MRGRDGKASLAILAAAAAAGAAPAYATTVSAVLDGAANPNFYVSGITPTYSAANSLNGLGSVTFGIPAADAGQSNGSSVLISSFYSKETFSTSARVVSYSSNSVTNNQITMQARLFNPVTYASNTYINAMVYGTTITFAYGIDGQTAYYYNGIAAASTPVTLEILMSGGVITFGYEQSGATSFTTVTTALQAVDVGKVADFAIMDWGTATTPTGVAVSDTWSDFDVTYTSIPEPGFLGAAMLLAVRGRGLRQRP